LYGATAYPAYQPAITNGQNATIATATTAPPEFAMAISGEGPFTSSSSSLVTRCYSRPSPETSAGTSATLFWVPGDNSDFDSGIFATSRATDANVFLLIRLEMLNELKTLAATDVNMISDEAWGTFMGKSRFDGF
jgi:hypothetical protein